MEELETRFHLRGKVAVVIGGAGYLCSAIAKAFVESGLQVMVLDLPETPPTHLGNLGPSLGYTQCDTTSKSSLQRAREEVLARWGKVDILVNGAGTNAPTPFFEISEKELSRILDVNLSGLFYSCQVFGEVMVARRAGSIINFASASSGPPLSKAFVYSVAKAGVVNLTQNLAREWAPFNVRVNALRPGFFPTEWSMKNFIDEHRKSKILGHTPMGRFGRPDELIGASLWLASEAATFVTGSVVAVDGGFTAMTI